MTQAPSPRFTQAASGVRETGCTASNTNTPFFARSTTPTWEYGERLAFRINADLSEVDACSTTSPFCNATSGGWVPSATPMRVPSHTRRNKLPMGSVGAMSVPPASGRLMNVFRFSLALALLLLPTPALADSDCEDTFFECKDDCLIEFGGSIRVEVKKRYDKCMKKCTKTANRCGERVMETKASGLDEGALDGTPASDQDRVSKKKKKTAAEPAAEDTASDDEPVRKKEALSESELPKSDRTTLKTDDAPPPSKKKEKEAEPKKEVIEMKMTPRKEEEDIRDDKPRASAPREEEAPPPKKKTEVKKDPPPPKRQEEDHDDLRNY